MSGMCIDLLSQSWAWHSGQCVHARNSIILWKPSKIEMPSCVRCSCRVILPLGRLGGIEMQLRLHSFEHKELQEGLVGNIALVGQRLELIQKRFWQPE